MVETDCSSVGHELSVGCVDEPICQNFQLRVIISKSFAIQHPRLFQERVKTKIFQGKLRKTDRSDLNRTLYIF